MNRFALKPEYMPLIETGRKRSTIRSGIRRVEPGGAAIVAGKQVIPVRLTRHVVKRFDELTEDDARTDGFDSLGALLEALRRFYPDLRGEDPVTIVYFDLEGAAA